MSRFRLDYTGPDKTSTKRLTFFCPGCKGHHFFLVAGNQPCPCWKWNGDRNLATFTPALMFQGGPNKTRCNSTVTNGRIQFYPDCSHELAGQTVDVPEYQ